MPKIARTYRIEEETDAEIKRRSAQMEVSEASVIDRAIRINSPKLVLDAIGTNPKPDPKALTAAVPGVVLGSSLPKRGPENFLRSKEKKP